jgi:hypothetical protein
MPTFFSLILRSRAVRQSRQISFSIDLVRGPSTLHCMRELSNRACLTVPGAGKRVRVKVNWLSGLLALAFLLGLCPVRADEADDQYLQIYGLIQQADSLNTNGKRAPAKAKYLEAFKALKNFQKSYPDSSAQLVAARLRYVAQQITVLSEEPPAAVTSGGTNAPEAKTETKAASPVPSGPLKLLGAGAEPRKVLSLRPKAGDKQSLVLKTKVALDTKMGGGQPSPIKLPATSASLDIPAAVTIKEVSSKGDITYEVALGDVSGAEEPAGAAAPPAGGSRKSPIGGVKGLAATGTISSHGFSKALDFKAPPGADAQTKMLLDLLKDVFIQLVTPLPEERVGAGAKWEVKAPVQSHSIKIDQTANYELVAVDGDQLKTKGTSTQQAKSQKMDNPIMPGVQVDLTKWTSKATSEFALEPGKLMPTSGTMELHSEMGMGMLAMGPQGPSFTMKMDVNIVIEGK